MVYLDLGFLVGNPKPAFLKQSLHCNERSGQPILLNLLAQIVSLLLQPSYSSWLFVCSCQCTLGAICSTLCSIHWHIPPTSWSQSTFHFHRVRQTPQFALNSLIFVPRGSFDFHTFVDFVASYPSWSLSGLEVLFWVTDPWTQILEVLSRFNCFAVLCFEPSINMMVKEHAFCLLCIW